MISKENATVEELTAKGEELEQQGSLHEAIVYWELAIGKSDNPSSRTLAKLANIAQQVGDCERAEKAYRTLGIRSRTV